MYHIGYLAYFECNIDYIIETYCVNKEKPELQCNGKCHLAKQMQTPTTSDNEQALISVVESFFPVFFSNYPNLEFNQIAFQLKKSNIFTSTQNYTYRFEYFHFKPPIL